MYVYIYSTYIQARTVFEKLMDGKKWNKSIKDSWSTPSYYEMIGPQ